MCAPSFIYPRVVGKQFLVIFVLAESDVRRDETRVDGLASSGNFKFIRRKRPPGIHPGAGTPFVASLKHLTIASYARFTSLSSKVPFLGLLLFLSLLLFRRSWVHLIRS